MTRLLSADEIRTHVETDLTDTALNRLIDDAEAEIIERHGPHAADGTIVEQHIVQPGERRVFPRRKLNTGSAVVVTRRLPGALAADATTATSDEYEVDTLGSIRLLAQGVWGGMLVTITYTPVADAARRSRVLIDLVRIAVRYEGARQAGMGDLSVSHVDYERERSSILARLGRMSNGFA